LLPTQVVSERGLDHMRKSTRWWVADGNGDIVGAGRQQREIVEAMHVKLRSLLPIDDVLVCYHPEGEGCGCRKPAPGMILRAAATWRIDLAASYMVGDRWRDVEAGRAGGCRTVFIRNQYDEPQPAESDAVVDSLGEATDLILSQHI